MPKNKDVSVREWRPEECHTRLGDIVLGSGGNLFLKVKCRRCTKRANADRFHTLPINPAPDNHSLVRDLLSLAEGLIDLSPDADVHTRLADLKERFKG